MSYKFRPAIVRDNGRTVAEFPLPVPRLLLRDSWYGTQFKVPDETGDAFCVKSRNGVDILLHGQVGTCAGKSTCDEMTMLDAVIKLREVLNVDAQTARYRLMLYWDAATNMAVYFDACATQRLTTNLSDPNLFTYTARIHANDPTLHTAPLV